jgi:hypothetical protein
VAEKSRVLFIDFANVNLSDDQQIKSFLEQPYPECMGYPLEMFFSLFLLEERTIEKQFSSTLELIFFNKPKLKYLQDQLNTCLENPDLFFLTDPTDTKSGSLEELLRNQDLVNDITSKIANQTLIYYRDLANKRVEPTLIYYRIMSDTGESDRSSITYSTVDTPHIKKNQIIDLIALSLSSYLNEIELKMGVQLKEEKEIKEQKFPDEIYLFRCNTCKKWISPDKYQLANYKRNIPMYCQDNDTCSPTRKRKKREGKTV